MTMLINDFLTVWLTDSALILFSRSGFKIVVLSGRSARRLQTCSERPVLCYRRTDFRHSAQWAPIFAELLECFTHQRTDGEWDLDLDSLGKGAWGWQVLARVSDNSDSKIPEVSVPVSVLEIRDYRLAARRKLSIKRVTVSILSVRHTHQYFKFYLLTLRDETLFSCKKFSSML